MYTLYSTLGSGGFAIEALLIEIGIPYRVHNLDFNAGEIKQDKYSAINPKSQVPFLVCPDNTVITETGAILMFLADMHPKANLLAKQGSAARATVLRWTFFAASNLYESGLRYYYGERYGAGKQTAQAIKTAAAIYFNNHLTILEKEIKGPFLLGHEISIFDYFIALLISWEIADGKAHKHPRLIALQEAVATRPKISALAKIHFDS